VVESNAIHCTHHDAFRFFTEAARPLNAVQPGSENRADNEQFGCVHFNMDLYRWCYKLNPWVGSELIDDCFRLAIEARILDMRASPYDVSQYGYDPIAIETAEGRELYRVEQKALYERGQPVAKRLLAECERLLGRADACVMPHS
ncbi:MAG: 3-methyladenine DNA glycosylase, partial [Verrucomicrobiia bacterium]